MFTLNEFSLDVICFLCYASVSVVQALWDSDEYFSKKFLCWSVSQLHNEYKLTKCEILLPIKPMKLWLSKERALSICSVSTTVPLQLLITAQYRFWALWQKLCSLESVSVSLWVLQYSNRLPFYLGKKTTSHIRGKTEILQLLLVSSNTEGELEAEKWKRFHSNSLRLANTLP